MKNRGIGLSKAVDFNDEGILFEERELEMPELSSQFDVIVRVLATAINPVDIKMAEAYQAHEFTVLGFDGVGDIVSVGEAVSDFAIGERVYYAGQQRRQGTNQLFQAVDSRLIAKVPTNLTIAQSAALPLTGITAYEILTDALGLEVSEQIALGQSILIINGAGGVGSILIQLAKFIGLRVITTASRSESVAWVKRLGADIVLNHHEDLEIQLKEVGIDKLPYIVLLHSTDKYWHLVTNHIAPFGRIASIVETDGPLDMGPLKNIGAQFAWEFMFAKGNFAIRMAEQGQALAKLAKLIETGKLKSTLKKTYDGFSAETFATASRDVLSGRMIGKVVIEY
ncbi:MAG: zinc-binding alcohol dehydrogenase family protein [Pseudolactococcus laudensis]